MTAKKSKAQVAIEQAAVEQASQPYILRLYIAGTTPRSSLAIRNIRKICEEHLHGRYDLQVIDVYQQPALSEDEPIVAVPTLVKKLPLPPRRFSGDMNDTERILVGLDLRTADEQGSLMKPAPASS